MRSGFAERILQGLPDPVFVLSTTGELLFANPAAERVLVWRTGDWIGTNVLSLVHPDDVQLVAVSFVSITSKQVGSAIEVRVATGDGGWRLLEVIGANHLDDPEIGGIVFTARDLTWRRRYEVAAGDSETFRQIVQHSAAITMLTDPDGWIRSASAAITRILGLDPELIVGRPVLELVSEVDSERAGWMFRQALAGPGTSTFDAYFAHADGMRLVPLELSVVNLCDDPIVHGLIISGHDITPLRDTQRQLEHLASHDPLTGLPNRVLLHDRLSSALARTSPSGCSVAVLFVDLDGLKETNDVLGHRAGDDMLRHAARQLESVTRPGDTVARYGGDEFVVVAEDVDHAKATRLAQRVEQALAKPVLIGSRPTQIRASVGVATTTEQTSADDLIAAADAAMYAVKATRRENPRHVETSAPVEQAS